MRCTRTSLVLLPLLAALMGCVPGAERPDLDADGWVGRSDVEQALGCIDLDPAVTPECASADTNGDGRIDGIDVLSLAADYGKRVCNGSASLCDRRYDQVSYATSHNAFAAWDPFTIFFNQWDDIPAQAAHGIRAFMLDAWYFDADGNGTIEGSETFLCHAECAFARRSLDEGLAEIAALVEARPGEIFTIIFESYVAAADIETAFERGGLSAYALPHVAGTPWPTLREMIEAGKRLVVLTDDRSSPAPDWLVHVWSVAWETHFTNLYTSDFSCAPNRGQTSNDLFILNHFLTRNTSVPGEAAQVNANPFLVERARQCWRESGRLPNFVTVDFATTGDVVEAARRLGADFTEGEGLPPGA